MCCDLRCTTAILASGRKLPPKEKNCADLCSYLRCCSITKKGLLVVQKDIPLQAKQAETIVIPREFALTAASTLHHKWNHPSESQMQWMFDRQFFMLDSAKILSDVFDSCQYPCQADRKILKETMTYKNVKTVKIASHFAADVLEDHCQKILVLRKHLTSYTLTKIIPDQTKATLKSVIRAKSFLKIDHTSSCVAFIHT